MSRFGWITVIALLVTATPAAAQVTVFEEDFEDAGDWTLETGWETSSSSASSGSGGNNLAVKGNAAASARTPVIGLSGASSATLTYLARRTASFSQANLRVTASTDGGTTFDIIVLDTVEALPSQTSTYRSISAALPVGSDIILRFEGQGMNASSANARIDDVVVTAVVPLEVSPSSLQFFASGRSSHELTLRATNRAGETLIVRAPEISNTVFSTSPANAVTLVSGAEQTYTVRFAPEVDGFYEGTLTLTHNLGSVAVSLSGSSVGGSFGFSTDSTESLESTSGIDIPLRLDFQSEEGLQGLQFRITWTDAALSLSSVKRASAVSSTTKWTLSHQGGTGYVDVLLLGSGTTSLASGLYDPLITATFDIADISEETRIAEIRLSHIVGALATPDATDPGITAGMEVHSIVITGRKAVFAASTESIHFGTVEVGSTASDSIVVSNSGGTSELAISAVSSTNALFAITPATASLQPNSRQTFTITFSPSPTSFGRQSATLTFAHNGEGDSTSIAVTGKGRGGRGDAEGDGAVDAMDVVHAIDFVLDRLTPDPAQAAAADLFPFPDGDGRLDVRDLTLMSQAIARGRWPDDVALPPLEESAGKGGISLLVVKYESEEASILTFDQDMPIRAIQLIIPADREMEVITPESGGMALYSGYDGRSLRLLMYTADGSISRAKALKIVVGGLIGSPTYATAIGAERERIPISTTVENSTSSPPEQPVVLGAPYPNPFSAGVDVLRFSGGSGDETVQIFDVLGREVWSGRASGEWRGSSNTGGTVAPGIYIVKSPAERRTWQLIVIR